MLQILIFMINYLFNNRINQRIIREMAGIYNVYVSIRLSRILIRVISLVMMEERILIILCTIRLAFMAILVFRIFIALSCSFKVIFSCICHQLFFFIGCIFKTIFFYHNLDSFQQNEQNVQFDQHLEIQNSCRIPQLEQTYEPYPQQERHFIGQVYQPTRLATSTYRHEQSQDHFKYEDTTNWKVQWRQVPWAYKIGQDPKKVNNQVPAIQKPHSNMNDQPKWMAFSNSTKNVTLPIYHPIQFFVLTFYIKNVYQQYQTINVRLTFLYLIHLLKLNEYHWIELCIRINIWVGLVGWLDGIYCFLGLLKLWFGCSARWMGWGAQSVGFRAASLGKCGLGLNRIVFLFRPFFMQMMGRNDLFNRIDNRISSSNNDTF